MHNTTAPANNMKFTRVCIDCGLVMNNVGYSRKRCPACARKAKLMACAAYNAAHKEDMSIPEPRPDTIPSPETIREHARARAETSGAALRRDNESARAEGLTYGLWRAKQEGRLHLKGDKTHEKH